VSKGPSWSGSTGRGPRRVEAALTCQQGDFGEDL